MKKFTVELGENQWPIVIFEGTYITKKELDLCMRALRKEQKAINRKYRKDRIIAEYEAKKKGEVTNGTDGQSSGSQRKSEDTGAAGAGAEGSSSKSSGGTVKKSADGSSGSNPVVAGGSTGQVSGDGAKK